MSEQGQSGKDISGDRYSEKTAPSAHHPSVRGHGVGSNDLFGDGIRGTW